MRSAGTQAAADRGRAPRWLVLVALLVVALLVHASPAAAQPSDDGAAPYRLPVEGRLLRAFEPSASAFGPGHRGVDLDAPVRAPVRAAGRGVVTHAGPVAGVTWVSIAHAGEVVTSYGPLTDLGVARGELVEAGALLGRLAAGGHGVEGLDRGLHWGARRAGTYVDPLELLRPPRARPSLVSDGGWVASDLAVDPYPRWDGGLAGGWLVHDSPRAAAPGYALAPNGNHLVLLSGLASSSAALPLDPAHLGYDPRAVTHLSYAGRHDAEGRDDDVRRDQLPYGPHDTWPGVHDAAVRLAKQLRAQAAREPGRAVDLLGHSMGGVVALYYLTHLHDPYDRTLPQIGSVVTIAAPLQGSDLARVVEEVDASPVGRPLLRGATWLARRADGAPAVVSAVGTPALGQLAVRSELVGELAEGWDAALEQGAGGPLATGTRVLTLGGATDAVVVAARARLWDPDDALPPTRPTAAQLERQMERQSARLEHQRASTLGEPASGAGLDLRLAHDDVTVHRVLPGGHDAVRHTEALRQVVWGFLAGEDVVASDGRLAMLVGGTVGDLASSASQLASLAGTARLPVAARTRRAASPPLTLAPDAAQEEPQTAAHDRGCTSGVAPAAACRADPTARR